MASSSNALKRETSTEEQFNEEDFQKQIKAVEEATNPDEYESRLDKIGGTVAKWMKLIFNRDFSNEEFKAEWLSIDEYKSMADECMMNSWRVVNLPDWSVEKKGTQKGDIVESRQTEFGKVYRFTGTVDCPAKFIFEEFNYNLTKMPEWNPTVLKSELIKDIDTGIDLCYQVTAGGGRGIVAPRDFVILRRNAQLSETGHVVTENPHSYICTGRSVTVPGYPPVKDFVRGNNKVGCWYLTPKTASDGKTEHTFQWLMCCDLKGKIPQFVIDAAFATVMLDTIKHVRKFVAESKVAGKY